MDPDLYSLLECSENSSIDQIRKNYKKLALQCHPDKNPKNEVQSTEMFANLTKAVNTLGDAKEKFKYDSKLLENRTNKKIIFDEIMFDELSQKKEEDGCFYYDCRCGGSFIYYTKDSSDFRLSKPITIDCDTCSLSLQILPSLKSS